MRDAGFSVTLVCASDAGLWREAHSEDAGLGRDAASEDAGLGRDASLGGVLV